jgi:hypothetical protein
LAVAGGESGAAPECGYCSVGRQEPRGSSSSSNAGMALWGVRDRHKAGPVAAGPATSRSRGSTTHDHHRAVMDGLVTCLNPDDAGQEAVIKPVGAHAIRFWR